MLNELQEKANAYTVEYADVQFPLRCLQEAYGEEVVGWQMGDTLFDDFSRDGLTYLLYRLGSYVDRTEARDLYYDDPAEFAHYVSLCYEYQKSEKLRVARRQRLIAALVTEYGQCLLEGLLTNYQPVRHTVVLDKIAQSGLPSHMTYQRFSPKEMLLFFKTHYLGESAVEFGLTVRNGETGLAALSYLLSVHSEDYIFTFPTTDRRRHLSRVGEIDLDLLFETVHDIELNNKLEITPVSTLRLSLTGYPDALYDEIMLHPGRSVAKTLPAILQYRHTRGLKTAAEKLADQMLTKVDTVS